MSHVVSIKTELKDLDAARLAAEELGGQLLTEVKQGRWYGRWVNDYGAKDAAYKLGIRPEDYGKCDAVIRFKDSAYDVMLAKNPETGGYRVYWDFFGPGATLSRHMGGQDARKLLQLYGVHKATLEAKKKGMLVIRQPQPNGIIRLQIQGRSL